jgi:transposase
MAERADAVACGERYEFWALDEARVGLKTVLRRRLCVRGERPTARAQHRFQCAYIWGAARVVGPPDSLFRWSRRCNREVFAEFLESLSARRPEVLKIVLLDNAGWHRALDLEVPDNIRFLFQQAHSPELNPMESGWQQIKRPLANRNPADLQQLVDWVDDSIGTAKREGWLASATQYKSIQTVFCESSLVLR